VASFLVSAFTCPGGKSNKELPLFLGKAKVKENRNWKIFWSIFSPEYQNKKDLRRGPNIIWF
jgi:hypothetical protein